MLNLTEISQSDCCGNGCANCILNPNTRKINFHDHGKINLILEYNKYTLMNNRLTTGHILDLHFKYTNVLGSAVNVLQIPAGHHILMRAPSIKGGESHETNFLLRPYSPYWVDTINLEFKILVNLKPNGLMSQYIKNLKNGDEVEFRGPIGIYEHSTKTNETKIIYVITQGIAIAPAVRVIEEILNNEEDISRIYLLACFSNLDQIIFRDRLQNYNGYWNFKCSIYLSKQNCKSSDCFVSGCKDHCKNFQKCLRYREEIYPHRLSNKDLERVCTNSNGTENEFILCGTRNFQDQLTESIKALPINVMEENIYKF